MNPRILYPLVIAGAFAAGWWLSRGIAPAPVDPHAGHAHGEASDSQPAAEVWTCPMHPEVRQDGPGSCPICGMPLVRADASAAAGSSVHVDPGLQQQLGMRLVEARFQTLEESSRAPLKLAYDERELVAEQTRVEGYVTRLHVRAAGTVVRRGQPLATIWSERIAQAADEWQLLQKLGRQALVEAAAERLRRLGVDPARLGERPGEFTVRASRDGVLEELGVSEGAMVSAGMPVARVRGTAVLWAIAEFREGEAQPEPGQALELELAALPGEAIAARALEPLPALEGERRVLAWRLEVANPDGRLKPGMLGEVQLAMAPRRVLAVPAEAVIRTGERNLVIVAEDDGAHFRSVPVLLGIEQDGMIAIRRGLSEGQRVVASGQFLIDSEANLRRAFAGEESADPHAGHAP
jgi:membrane fusion protein, copper/silver efflux system